MPDSPRETSSSSPARRPYKTPKLRSYGNIRDITRDVGNNSPAHDSYPPTKPAGSKRTAL